MNNTGIIWSEATWNPMSGCKEVSEGCKFCYAKTLAESKRGTPAFRNGFDLTIREHKLIEPFKIKQPTLIFVNSMSDLFWEEVPQEYRHRIIDVIEQTSQHEYQVLTKHPENMLRFSKERKLPANFWAGTTIENNRNLFRLNILQEVEAEVHFISAEPLISPIDFTNTNYIDWIITGGESGTHLYQDNIADKRGLVKYNRKFSKWEIYPEKKEWIRNIRDICIQNKVKFFHKQWGGNYPEAAGRELDGRTWNEIPRLPAQRSEINNDYLRHLEMKKEGDKERQLELSLY